MSRAPILAFVLAGLVGGASGCAAQGGEDGGGANLPNRGIVPWTRVTPDEAAFILVPPADAPAVRWREPCALVTDGAVRLYLEARDTDTGDAAVLWAESPDGAAFTAPSVALDDAAAPSVTEAPDGTLWMAFVSPDGATLGLASSLDGERFTVVDPAVVVADDGATVDAPSLVHDGAQLIVYYARTDADGSTHIARVRGVDGSALPAEVVLEAGTGCVDPSGDAEPCWDADGVDSPDVRLATTAAGRRVFRLFYRGARGASGGLGFAASYDGLSFSRFAFNPVYDERFDERGPSSVRLGDRYLLYWAEERSATVHGVAVAEDAPDAPADTW
ncbi:MAG: hypothetical protein EP329_20280 [Deltaproteobacteria bacterium]|nr:MAG: hypothetical protein EP329_20280 [Deltaproteobacteria bacterium]